MKKVLYGTTALIAAGMLSAGTAQAAEKIKLSLGGYSKWYFTFSTNDDNYTRVGNTAGGVPQSYPSFDVQGENEVHFMGSTKLDNGLTVGIQVEMRAGGTRDSGATSATDPIDESYVYVQGGFGKIILGTENNAEYLMHVNAPDATGNMNEGGLFQGGNLVQKPGSVSLLAISTNMVTDGDAEKLTYLSPKFYGFTLGASYIPQAGSEDQQTPQSDMGLSWGTGYVVAVGYDDKIGAIGIKGVAGFETLDSRNNTEYKEYVVGLSGTYAGFTVGGAYRKFSETLGGYLSSGAVPTSERDGYAWDLGIMYATGPMAFSFGYFKAAMEDTTGVNKDDKSELWQVGAKYNMGPGVDFVALGGHQVFTDDNARQQQIGDRNHNKGWGFATGLQLTF